MQDIHDPNVFDTSTGMYFTLKFGGASFLYQCGHLILTCLQISWLHTCQSKKRRLGVSRPLEIFVCKFIWQTRCTCWIGNLLLSRLPGPRLRASYRSACTNQIDRFVLRLIGLYSIAHRGSTVFFEVYARFSHEHHKLILSSEDMTVEALVERPSHSIRCCTFSAVSICG